MVKIKKSYLNNFDDANYIKNAYENIDKSIQSLPKHKMIIYTEQDVDYIYMYMFLDIQQNNGEFIFNYDEYDIDLC